MDKLNNLISKKQEERMDLQNEKEYLHENMCNPDSISDNEFDLEENKRQLNILTIAKDHLDKTGSTDSTAVFNEMLKNSKELITKRKEQGINESEDVKDYTSVKILKKEMEESENQDNNQNNDQGGDSASMDAFNSDE